LADRRRWMRIPGYDAEASVYRSSVQYRTVMAAGIARSGAVAGQQLSEFLSIPLDPCDRVCLQRGCSARRACCICEGGVPVPNPRFPCGFFCALF
jgi:hypothetical protein